MASTLRWYAKDLQNHAPLEVTVEIVGDERPLNSAIKIALFRVAQEALNNVARHAGVSEVAVRLWARDGLLHILVEDRGTGFDPANVKATSTGISGMRERVLLLGGKLQVDSAPGTGTTLTAQLPLPAGSMAGELRV